MELSSGQKTVVDRVKALVEKLRVRSRERQWWKDPRDTPAKPGWTVDFALMKEEPNVISILGRRGYGKTTALLEVLNQLAGEWKENVILTPVNVDRFGKIDHPLGWIVSSFHPVVEALAEGYFQLLSDESELSLDDCFRQLLSKVYKFSSATLEALKRYEEPPELFLGMEAVVSGGLEIQRDFRDFLNRFLDSFQKKYVTEKLPMVIIPIDDPDLSPEIGEELLKAIQVIGFHQNLVFLTCMDLDTIQFAVKANTLAQFRIQDLSKHPGIITSEVYHVPEFFIQGLTVSKVNKLIPNPSRCDLQGATFKERLEFRPNFQTERTLLDLLMAIQLHETTKEPLPRSLGDFFDISWSRNSDGGTLLTSQFTSCLLGGMRHLTGLYELFESYPDGGQPWNRSRLWSLLYRLWRTSIETWEHIPFADYLGKLVVWFREREFAQFDFSYGKTAIILTPKRIVGGSTSCFLIDRFQIYPGETLEKPLPTSCVMLLSLYHDILHFCKDLGAVYRSMAIHDIKCVWPKGESALSWPVPRWETVLQYSLFQDGWNDFLNKAGTLSIEVLLYNFLHLCLSISVGWRVPPPDYQDISLQQLQELVTRFAPEIKDNSHPRKWLGALCYCLELTMGKCKITDAFKPSILATWLALPDFSEDGKKEWEEILASRQRMSTKSLRRIRGHPYV